MGRTAIVRTLYAIVSLVHFQSIPIANFKYSDRTEMLRLKDELEMCFAEDRMEAVQKAQREHLDDVAQLKETFSFREKMLQDELEAIREKLADRNRRLDEANEKADKQIMQIRMILNKSEQGHQREVNSQALQHENEIGKSSVLLNEHANVSITLFIYLFRAIARRICGKRDRTTGSF